MCTHVPAGIMAAILQLWGALALGSQSGKMERIWVPKKVTELLNEQTFELPTSRSFVTWDNTFSLLLKTAESGTKGERMSLALGTQRWWQVSMFFFFVEAQEMSGLKLNLGVIYEEIDYKEK